MYKILTSILGSVLFLQTPLHGQSYRPFIPHLTYVYECQYERTNNEPDVKGAYGLKIDSAYSVGIDSVFLFNQIGRGFGAICPYQDNIMGGKMIEKPNGDYQFIANEFDTTMIRTQVPLQNSWAYDSTTTATLVSRTERDVLGQVDSVLIISLSTGDSLILSKNLGLVNAQAILPIEDSYYIDFTTFANKMKPLIRLIGIDELGLGQSYFNRRDIYDYAIGDVYLYKSSSTCYSEIFTYRWKRVLDRRESLDGDTLYYEYEIEEIGITPHWAGFPLPPGYPGDTTHKGTSYFYETVNLSKWVFPPKLLSYEYDIPSGFHLHGPYNNPNWNDRLSYVFNPLGSLGIDSCYFNFEGGSYYTFTQGLGTNKHSIAGPTPVICRQLIAYQKSTDTAGLWIEPQMLVSNESELSSSSLKLYPNPSEDLVQIEFCTEQAIQNWQLKLIDIQGRTVKQMLGFEASNCLNQTLDVSNFPQGIYTLQMISAEGRVLQTSKWSKY